ncbi:DUF5677 domain-containing protein [Candidatus Manganitrophus noduliformans]|uniref:Uncharacterized protein n=1 Tax=Candidatus Manganitrophus noduliformans TaxID=2606439 RepID=A0A7X6DT60_9BACT|nr:DUF5677 domain-containing protein [Candidatus Manganitrophus noduliformans]NKE72802.1 hypothetical protein [Candidatus Manganitrophus noduliformans]
MAETRVALPKADELERGIFDTHRSLISAAKATWGLANELIIEGEVVGKGKSTIHNVCLAGNYTKQLRLYVANLKLSLAGLDLESFLILRSMYTHALHLQALEHSKDPEVFARDWVLWDLASDEKAVRNLAPFADVWKDLKEKLFSADALGKDKARYGELWSRFLEKGPTLVSMAELSVILQAEETYRLFYPLTSAVTHGADLLNYSRPKAENKIDILVVPPPKWVGPNLAAGISFLRDTCAHVNTLLALGKDKVIDDMTKIVSSLSEKKLEFKALEKLNIDWIERAKAKKAEKNEKQAQMA